MDREAVVIAVHGMGETRPDFANELWRELLDRVGAARWAKVHCDTVYYQSLFQVNQLAAWRRLKQKDLDWTRLRKFVLYGFSDAAGLDYQAHVKNSAYEQSQRRIYETLEKAYDLHGPKPAIVIAQSLGCHLISNYLWDAQSTRPSRGLWANPPQGLPPEKETYLRLKGLKFFYTTGCNIPIFVAGLPKEKIKAVTSAGKGYKFEWKNFYDEDDVLGWPLKPLSDTYRKSVTRDYDVNSGGLIDAWNPLSHGGYWTDREVTDRLAGDIRELLAP